MSPSRRRQRSVRVLVAASLLVVAALAVIPAVVLAITPVLIAASIFSLLAGVVAARIISNELAQTRREWAADRAAQAQGFRAAMVAQLDEQAVFATAMTERLVRRDTTIVELRGTIKLADARASEAEQRVRREARRVSELQSTVEQLRSDHESAADAVAIWEGADMPTIVDLLNWEQNNATLAITDDRLQA